MKGLIAGRSRVTLFLMAGMFVLPSVAVEMPQESSVEEFGAAAQGFGRCQQEDRVMKMINLGVWIVILLLMVGMFFLSLAAAARAPSGSARPPAAATLAPCTRHQTEAEAESQASTEAGARASSEARGANLLTKMEASGTRGPSSSRSRSAGIGIRAAAPGRGRFGDRATAGRDSSQGPRPCGGGS